MRIQSLRIQSRVTGSNPSESSGATTYLSHTGPTLNADPTPTPWVGPEFRQRVDLRM